MTLVECADSAWNAFVSVGGTEDMYLGSAYSNPAQAYYGGQVWAYNRMLHKLGMPIWPFVDYDDLEQFAADYV